MAVNLDSILQSNETLHPLDAASLRTAHSLGVKVVLASAKAPQGIHRYWAQLGLGTPVIAFNGALVYDFPSHKHVLGQPLPPESVRSALEIAHRLAPKASIAVERGDTWVVRPARARGKGHHPANRASGRPPSATCVPASTSRSTKCGSNDVQAAGQPGS